MFVEVQKSYHQVLSIFLQLTRYKKAYIMSLSFGMC